MPRAQKSSHSQEISPARASRQSTSSVRADLYYTIRPEQYQVQRMCALVQGYTSKADAELLMGSTPLKRRIRGYDKIHSTFAIDLNEALLLYAIYTVPGEAAPSEWRDLKIPRSPWEQRRLAEAASLLESLKEQNHR